MVSVGDTVTVEDNGGRYCVEILDTDEFTDQNGNQLYGAKIVEVHEQPDTVEFAEGETCNIRPSTIV